MKKLLTILLLAPLFVFGQTRLNIPQIKGATALGIPFINGSNVMAQDATFLYDPSTHTVRLNASSNSGKTITWLGDSIILGTGLSTGVRYSSQVSTALGYTEDNQGVSGSTAHTGNQSLIPTYSSSTYAYLFIAYGTNDYNVLGSSASTFGTDMTTFVNAAIAKGWPANLIYIISMYGFQAQSPTNYVLYNTALQNMCTSLGCNYVNVYTPILTNIYGVANDNTMTQDGTHPNQEGSQALFKIVSNYIPAVYNITNQSIVSTAPIESIGVKLRNYGFQTVANLVGSRPDGTLAPLVGLPTGTRALGKFYLSQGLFQDGGFATAGADTTKDIILAPATKIFSNKNSNSLNGWLQLFDPTTGFSNFTNTYVNGAFIFTINGLQALKTDYTGQLTVGGNVHLNSTSYYYEQSVSGSGYGRLQLFDGSGDTYFRNSWNTGRYKWYMSDGTTGTQVEMLEMSPTGRVIMQEGGTFTPNANIRLTVNSTTEGVVFSRMTTSQRDLLGQILAPNGGGSSAGSGYTSIPTVTFSAPTGAGGVTATGTAVMSGGTTGVVNAITMTNNGSGYTSAPTITFTGGSPSVAASFTPTITLSSGILIFNTTLGVYQVFNSTTSSWDSLNPNAPGIKASADLTAQTAVGNITTFTVGSSTATFNISSYLNVTAISTDVIQVQVTYTDENNTSQTISMNTVNSVTNANYNPVTIRAKNATVITVKTNLSVGAGSVTFDAGARITQL